MKLGSILLPLSLAVAGAVAAVPAAAQEAAGPLQPGEVIDFAADTLTAENEGQLIIAAGNVIVARDGYRLRADEVRYNRASGVVTASGNVIVVDPSGNQAFGDRIELTETLRDGTIDNILLVLEDGGRLAARRGVRIAGRSELERAVYSPCEIHEGCGARPPVWQLKAVRVVHDPERRRLFYRDVTLEFLGVPLLYLPTFSHPDGSAARASGLLAPDVRHDRSLGFSLELPYVLTFGSASDLTLTPHIYTSANPALGAEYRRLLADGPFRVGGVVTHASRLDVEPTALGGIDEDEAIRGYFYGNGRFQHSRRLRSTFGVRLTTDDTFLRRYDISRDDTLRNFYSLERFGGNSYLAVEGWAFQGLRQIDRGGQTPIALPLVNFSWRPSTPILGGQTTVRANTLTVTRTDGQDMRRGIASAEWQATGYTGLGQRLTATALLRGDVYHSSDNELADVPGYAGRNGWEGRALPLAALEMSWPFAGPALGGVQTITPRIQLVASPDTDNSGIPNEDARAIDLEDVNLFSLNRFPGYDRWEGGPRVTYGATWTLDRPLWRVRAEIGQSYRLNNEESIIPEGTGLAERLSDVVGRTSLAFGRYLSLTHRFRLDKDNLAIRRNEIDTVFGTSRTYATISYVRLNRDIFFEDLPDREEIRLGARLAFLDYWSVFGSTIVDLTSANEDPTSTTDGFEPIRHRIGLAYEDECFEFGIAWRRDYTQDRDYRRGNTFILQFALKNLGR